MPLQRNPAQQQVALQHGIVLPPPPNPPPLTNLEAHSAVRMQQLGKHNIICIEDLVHEIYNVGPAFTKCTNFLWPFKLNTPTGGLPKKRLHFIEGGQAGNREAYINNLVRAMN